MKVLSILLALVAAGIVYFFVLGTQSKQQPSLGLKDGKLANCPNKPNCICSEEGAITKTPIEPLNTTDKTQLKQAIEATGGVIHQEQDNYITATYTSKIFNFVDDVELRIDIDAGVTHIRSASRVGHSDLGANEKRVEAIRVSLTQ